MKRLLKSLINRAGYEIARKHTTVIQDTDIQSIVSRNSMIKAVEWLSKNNFVIKTVLDVGASDGRWTKDCMNYFPESDYVLFEPQSCHFNSLDILENESDRKVTVVKKAVGQKSGKTYFDNTDAFGGSLRNSKSNNSFEVSLTSLDDSIQEKGLKGPYFIKLDTHGFEIEILEGAKKSLDECNILIIEAYNYKIERESVLFWQLCDYLHKKGFRPIDMVDIMYREYDNSLWQMDIVFIKSTWSGFDHIGYT